MGIDPDGDMLTDYEATDYAGLIPEISDDFGGETGDLVREHAKAVVQLRRLSAELSRLRGTETQWGVQRFSFMSGMFTTEFGSEKAAEDEVESSDWGTVVSRSVGPWEAAQ